MLFWLLDIISSSSSSPAALQHLFLGEKCPQTSDAESKTRTAKKIRKNFCSSVNLGEIVPGEQICVVFRQENHLEMGSPGFKKSQLTI